MLMGQQTHLFGAYNQDGSAVSSVLPGPVFQEEIPMGGNEDTNDAKRRRIARVRVLCCCANLMQKLTEILYRHAICVEERR